MCFHTDNLLFFNTALLFQNYRPTCVYMQIMLFLNLKIVVFTDIVDIQALSMNIFLYVFFFLTELDFDRKKSEKLLFVF